MLEPMLDGSDKTPMFSKRPLLVSGLGLSATLWLIDMAHVNLFNSSTLLGAIALSSGVWWWRQRQPQPEVVVQPQPVSRDIVEQSVARTNDLISQLEAETTAPPNNWQPRIETYRQQGHTLLQALERSELNLGIVGEAGCGKSKLQAELQSLQLPRPCHLQELRPQQVSDAQDALLLLTPGDLTESAREQMLRYITAGQAVLLVFSKQDHYLPEDREQVLQQLQRRAAEMPVSVEVVAIAANPSPLRVRRHSNDNQLEEFLEPVPADLGLLPETLKRLVSERAEQLILATTLRQVDSWRRDIQKSLNEVRRQRAMPVVEQLQWTAAATAFAIPIASLDLLAAAAINAQLLMDLGKIYDLSWSWDEAKALATNLAQLTVKLGLVEISTQALSLALKGHPATYAVGGTLQGLSVAYLTRMVGLSLIETLEAAALENKTSSSLSLEKLSQRLRELLLQNRQGRFLQGLVEQGMKRLPLADNSTTPLATTP